MIITLSDRASAGEYTDRSGPKVKEAIETFSGFNNFKNTIENVIIPDDETDLKNILLKSKNKATNCSIKSFM